MSQNVRVAEPGDMDLLLKLMGEFYAESSVPLDRERSAEAFAELIDSPSLGRVWIMERDGETAGYIVLTLGYSMEYGGRDAFVDDLFVREPYRGKGLGRMALEVLFEECRRRKVRAVHLEVDRENVAAKQLYKNFGFKDNDRQLLTCQSFQREEVR